MSTNLLPFIFTLLFITTQQQQNDRSGQENNADLVFIPLMTKSTAEYMKLIKMLRRPSATNNADSEMYNYKMMPNIQDGRPKRQLAAAFGEGSILTVYIKNKNLF